MTLNSAIEIQHRLVRRTAKCSCGQYFTREFMAEDHRDHVSRVVAVARRNAR